MKYLSALWLTGAFPGKPREAVWKAELALVKICGVKGGAGLGGCGPARCGLLFDLIHELQEDRAWPCSPLNPQHPKQSLAHSGPL